jgi:hypothetical protein
MCSHQRNGGRVYRRRPQFSDVWRAERPALCHGLKQLRPPSPFSHSIDFSFAVYLLNSIPVNHSRPKRCDAAFSNSLTTIFSSILFATCKRKNLPLTTTPYIIARLSHLPITCSCLYLMFCRWNEPSTPRRCTPSTASQSLNGVKRAAAVDIMLEYTTNVSDQKYTDHTICISVVQYAHAKGY